MSESNPAMLADAGQTEKARKLWRGFKRDIFIAAAIDAYFAAGTAIALHRLPAGEVFNLSPHGFSVVRDLLGVALINAIYIAYLCLALAFHSRAMLGHLVKILFFLLFVAFLFSVQAGHAIAVVRTDSAFVFVRPAPFAPEIIPMDRVPEVQVYNTGVVRALTLLRFKGYGMDYVECRGVWVSDRRACEVLDQLVRSLNKVRSAHMPMPLHFNSP